MNRRANIQENGNAPPNVRRKGCQAPTKYRLMGHRTLLTTTIHLLGREEHVVLEDVGGDVDGDVDGERKRIFRQVRPKLSRILFLAS